MIAIAIIAILMAVLLPNYVRAKSRSRLTTCESGMRNMATALELYARNNSDLYPTSLGLLAPNYMAAIPSCPSAGNNLPYLNGFSSSTTNYTMSCSGSSHQDIGVPSGYPQYYLVGGLKEQ